MSQNRCLYCKLLLHHTGGSEITGIIFIYLSLPIAISFSLSRTCNSPFESRKRTTYACATLTWRLRLYPSRSWRQQSALTCPCCISVQPCFTVILTCLYVFNVHRKVQFTRTRIFKAHVNIWNLMSMIFGINKNFYNSNLWEALLVLTWKIKTIIIILLFNSKILTFKNYGQFKFEYLFSIIPSVPK